MNNIIKYAKAASEAFKTYTEGERIDYELCNKIYNYIYNIKLLNKTEKEELDIFIKNNTFDIIHLANIYTSPKRKKTLEKQLTRMAPFEIAKPDGKIYEARGDFSNFVNIKAKQSIKIKRKTYHKKTA